MVDSLLLHLVTASCFHMEGMEERREGERVGDGRADGWTDIGREGLTAHT